MTRRIFFSSLALIAVGLSGCVSANLTEAARIAEIPDASTAPSLRPPPSGSRHTGPDVPHNMRVKLPLTASHDAAGGLPPFLQLEEAGEPALSQVAPKRFSIGSSTATRSAAGWNRSAISAGAGIPLRPKSKLKGDIGCRKAGGAGRPTEGRVSARQQNQREIIIKKRLDGPDIVYTGNTWGPWG